MSGSKQRTGLGSERVGESGKRKEMTESRLARSWETKSQEPPLDFFLGWFVVWVGRG